MFSQLVMTSPSVVSIASPPEEKKEKKRITLNNKSNTNKSNTMSYVNATLDVLTAQIASFEKEIDTMYLLFCGALVILMYVSLEVKRNLSRTHLRSRSTSFPLHICHNNSYQTLKDTQKTRLPSVPFFF